jgi:catechol 2,3-dioxygenase-like lactoylglutathione lyase family enzyme
VNRVWPPPVTAFTTTHSMQSTSAAAVFQVSDLERSLAFYTEILGFERDFVVGSPPFYAGLKRGGVALHLSSASESAVRLGRGSVYLFCDTVDSFYREVSDLGAVVTSPLDSHDYGMRDFQIKDPDGNLIGFGAPLAP